jgi:diadenosine tetraphosphatase ApaH/serine/threonine PP2A family protein phosphatase
VRYLILSDLHGNWSALEAIVREARDWERVLFLGDAVGYYPDAERVVSWLTSHDAIGVLGNHDAWMLSLGSLDVEGPILEIIAWQAERMSASSHAYLSKLPVATTVEGALLVHGSPCDPMQYLDDLELARQGFDCTAARWVFHGHTHLAGAYLSLDGPNGQWVRYQRYTNGGELILAPKVRAIVNPGSVGQPRDGTPGAAYAIWDSEEDLVEFYRVTYDLKQVLRRIEEAGFPNWLYERLLQGK